MNTNKKLCVLFLFMLAQIAIAQEKKGENKKEVKQTDNFMDLQANTLTNLFGSDLSGDPDGKQLNFLELLEQTDLPEDQKKEWRNYYYLQSKELTQKQKDSLSLALHEKMQKAMINNH